MSTHPNAILMVVFTPDNLARKTHRAIVEEYGLKDIDDKLQVGGDTYHHFVMENSEGYHQGFQITAPEGSIVFFDYVTYGYGEVIDWDGLQKQKEPLEEWAKGICERHHCSYKIQVTANYW